MLSPWRCPLPSQEHTTSQVVVYFYNGRWIPITFYSLMEAILLHCRAKLENKEVFVFPSELNPSDFHSYFKVTRLHQTSQTNIVALNDKTKPEATVILQTVNT